MTTRSAVQQLERQLQPDSVLTGRAFDDRRRVWNGMVDHLPAVIVRPTSVEHVVTAVRVARRCALPLSVRGGGHDWAGRAVRPGGLVIDLGAMRSVTVDGDVATVGGGATGDDVQTAARTHGLAAALGTIGSVGAVGLILGGGYGSLIGVTGLGVDNLLSAQIVLADGSIVETNDEDEPDLFWALRGGGGNFGVVTSIDIRLHPIPDVTAGMVAFGRTEAAQVLRGLQRLHDEADDALDVMFGAMHTPAGPVLYTTPVWAGSADAGPAEIDRVRRLGAPVLDDVSRRPLADLVRSVGEQFPAGTLAHFSSRIVARITDEFVEAFLRCCDDMPDGCALNVHHAHGAATRVPVAATAHAYREPHLVIEILGLWHDGQGGSEVAWVEASKRRLDAVAVPGGWTNLMDAHDPRIQDAFGANRSRLLDVKKRYDPDNAFTATGLPQ